MLEPWLNELQWFDVEANRSSGRELLRQFNVGAASVEIVNYILV
jgi:hypothetical protein